MGNLGCGCPGSMARVIERPENNETTDVRATSELRQWPVQLHLVPPTAPYFNNADILVCADCVAFAMGSMHRDLLKGKSLAIACPKLDDTDSYVDKLAQIFKTNNTPSVTVAIMEVPCCRGLDIMVKEAIRKSGRDIPLETVIIGIDGNREELMKADITQALVEEHRLILRMIALLERNAVQTKAGACTNWQFYLDGVDFIRHYADRFHHAKEEDVLFAALVENGMPRENSPVAAMLMEHEQGRKYVLAMELAAREALYGKIGQERIIVENALAYAALLRDHIDKEDNILYPLAERIIPDAMRDRILENYHKAESQSAADFRARYQAMVERYEQEYPENSPAVCNG